LVKGSAFDINISAVYLHFTPRFEFPCVTRVFPLPL
jgi:hypothetical protein